MLRKRLTLEMKSKFSLKKNNFLPSIISSVNLESNLMRSANNLNQFVSEFSQNLMAKFLIKDYLYLR